MAEVSPTRIATRRGPALNIAVSEVTSTSIASSREDSGIDPWHKTIRVRGNASQQPVQYTVHQSVLYPGAVVTVEDGPVLPLRVQFSGRGGTILEATAAELQEAGLPVRKNPVTVYALCDSAGASPPLLIALAGLSANVTQSNEALEISLARVSAKQPGRAYIFAPTGIAPVRTDAKSASLADLLAAADVHSSASTTLARWLSIGLNEPAGADEFFRVLDGDQSVRVYQVARYRSPLPAGVCPPVALRPPQVDHAISAFNYPVHPPTTATGLLTFSGMAHGTVVQAEETTNALTVTWYDLPVRPMKERALLAVPGQKPLRDLLNKWALTELGLRRRSTQWTRCISRGHRRSRH